ncbi:uncharacterized protein MONBRDRAFT_34790 [Monosiga brevicollis MX1]|uniref:Uncharacterized protein n=1 Tax=Monosiga brevicollis TaxID=81824 RepID=A9VE32_MONBE|nr:uncharacterized protein MONBRDRAFT_34790 [Monosiga brevicollis MX1]EDQ84208.1 predicted protein [Monosiga brevicollis MX1]|eukprot:XP_001750996.1 hypothetical protein [Monosiga brevicollis MX1]
MARALAVLGLVAVLMPAQAQLLPPISSLPRLSTRDAEPRGRAERSATKVNGQALLGTFVADCEENNSWFAPDDVKAKNLNVSSAQTLRYYYNSTFVSDWTEYLAASDPTCRPDYTDVFAKYTFSGTFANKGTSSVNSSLQLAEWDHDVSSWLFPATDGSLVNYILQVLNQECRCGSDWVAGQQRTIDADKDCTPAEIAQTDVFYLCHIVLGHVGYGTYTWANEDTYLSSYIGFDKTEAWAQDVASLERHKLPCESPALLQRTDNVSAAHGDFAHGPIAGGNHDAGDCDYVRFSECGAGINDAISHCKGCDGLECDGCLYRELPEDVDATDFSDCCPCFYFYGISNRGWSLTAKQHVWCGHPTQGLGQPLPLGFVLFLYVWISGVFVIVRFTERKQDVGRVVSSRPQSPIDPSAAEEGPTL